ncbi:exosortase U [Aureliella helgolandensis]|uniref:Transmembrane exosortase (Exosortase_EpsH) n=1 Tax=Aureliella helgolandensis TaxID=2527968 RepID=A0A518GC17_9BACT|nr:exosortase U [Aureliella helgolandensis]QDV26145.1 Transmembrane exosortase (Exosortase_EpsH) [Aureliella helgolandensis]
MNTLEKTRSSPAANRWWDEFGPVVPLVAVLSALPYVLVYGANLWRLPHYQFFPVLVVAIAYLIWKRRSGRLVLSWNGRAVQLVLLVGGVFGLLCATIFASPWMGYFGFAMCFASWLAGQRDGNTPRSLLYLAIPVALIWQPPYNTLLTADTILIQQLQAHSARLSSQWLDLLGYAHHQPGTVLEFAGRSFGVAEACSGIQSFFAVLCFGALLVAFFRRGPIHTILLLATSPCWALLMNTIRITAIPVAFAIFEVDLSHGLLHDLLGFGTMALALGLLVSTDELLVKLTESLQPYCGTWWGDAADRRSDAPQTHTQQGPGEVPPSSSSQGELVSSSSLPLNAGETVYPPYFKPANLILLAPMMVFFAFCFGIQTYDVSQSWGQQKKVIDFFRDEPLIEMSFRDAPENLLGWPQRDYVRENRERGNDDLGQRSDLWYYAAPFGTVSISFDQMFPGWHELTRCYRSAGWEMTHRLLLDESQAGNWPIVMAEFKRGGEFGYLLFSLVDRSGKPVKAPGQWNKWTSLQERLTNRLTPAVRGALFGIAAYQVQIFIPSVQPLPEDARNASLERFLAIREILWEAAEARIP